jgi:hypothetical protein
MVMRKASVLFLAGVLLTVFPAAVPAQQYDRYERYDRRPPPRQAPAPPPRHAVHGQTYFFGQVGFFDPNNDADGLRGYSSGYNFGVGIGSRVSPHLAVEGMFGAFGADRGPNEVLVIPVTIGARLILPSPVMEPYIGGGVGLYFADLDEPTVGPAFIDDSDTTLGGYFSLGIDAWLNPRTALNFEGKYHVAEPRFEGIDVDVSGWTLSLGVRVSF